MSTQSQSTHQAPARPARPPLIPAADFAPSPELAEKLLSILADSDYSLGSAAHIANTSIQSLTIWLTKPEISARLDALESVMARKVRLDITNNIPLVIHACTTVLGFFSEAMNHRHVADTDHRGHEIRSRESSNALLASKLILHIGRQYSANPPRSGSSNPNRNHNPNPNLPNPNSTTPNTTDPFRVDLLPRLQDPTLNLHDQRSANYTTTPNPTRDNTHAFTSPLREQRSDAGDEAPRIPGPIAQGVPDVTTATAIAPSLPTSDLPPPTSEPATPDSTSCACHSKRKSKSCGACASHTPTQILISAGTTTPREREHPKPSR